MNENQLNFDLQSSMDYSCKNLQSHLLLKQAFEPFHYSLFSPRQGHIMSKPIEKEQTLSHGLGRSNHWTESTSCVNWNLLVLSTVTFTNWSSMTSSGNTLSSSSIALLPVLCPWSSDKLANNCSNGLLHSTALNTSADRARHICVSTCK
jgi:hypothetical protein